jgi:hypothetical protein
MSTGTPDLRTILKHAAAGIGAAVGLYFALDNLWVVNHVGLLHRQGFPWSSLPVWIAFGIAAGLERGVWMDLRMRRHETSFDARHMGATSIQDPAPGPDLIADDAQDPWERDPTLSEMPLLRQTSRAGSRTQTHEISHRMTGTHQDRPIEVFDLTSHIRTVSDESTSNQTLRRTVVLLPDVGLPAFELRPRTLFRRFLRGVGLSGLDFDPRQVETVDDSTDVATFIKSYNVGLEDVFVSGPDRAEAAAFSPDGGSAAEDGVRRVFTPAAMQVLNRWPGWSVESHGGHLAFWREDGWFIPAGERPARVAEALAIAGAFEAARRGDDRSGPVPAGFRLSPRERLIRRQVTTGVGCAGALGGAFLGFAVFSALMIVSEPPLGARIKPGPPLLFMFFPFFPLGGALIGGPIGAAVGRLAVFPKVRDGPPLARPGSHDRVRRGLSWRSIAGMFLGFFLGAILGMSTVFLMTARNQAVHGPSGAFIPLVFFGGAAIGLFAGMTIGLILDFRHAARVVGRKSPERRMSVADR